MKTLGNILVPLLLTLVAVTLMLSFMDSRPPRAGEIVSDTLRQWLAHQPCVSPCWQGITPHDTNLEQAKANLESLGLVEIYALNDFHDGTAELQWTELNNRNEINNSGSILFRKNDVGEFVTAIVTLNPHENLRLADITHAFGTPDKVFTKEGLTPGGAPFYRFMLFYLDFGIVIDSTVRHSDSETNFSPSIISQEDTGFLIFLLESGEGGFKSSWSMWGDPALLDSATPWKGSWNFSEYLYCEPDTDICGS